MVVVLNQHPLSPSKHATECYECMLGWSGMFSKFQNYYTTIYCGSRWEDWLVKK